MSPRLRLELAADLAAPRAVFKRLVQPSCLLDGRNVLPRLVNSDDDCLDVPRRLVDEGEDVHLRLNIPQLN